jgi:hypothetical protein
MSRDEEYTTAQQALLDTAVQMFEGLSPDDQQTMLGIMAKLRRDQQVDVMLESSVSR